MDPTARVSAACCVFFIDLWRFVSSVPVQIGCRRLYVVRCSLFPSFTYVASSAHSGSSCCLFTPPPLSAAVVFPPQLLDSASLVRTARCVNKKKGSRTLRLIEIVVVVVVVVVRVWDDLSPAPHLLLHLLIDWLHPHTRTYTRTPLSFSSHCFRSFGLF